MRGAAGLDPDHRWRQLGEETLDLSASQPLLHDDASGRILAVHLENRFGNVEPDHASIHLDGPLCWSDIKAPAWHIRCRQGTVHPALRGAKRRSNPVLERWKGWIASRSLSSDRATSRGSVGSQ